MRFFRGLGGGLAGILFKLPDFGFQIDLTAG